MSTMAEVRAPASGRSSFLRFLLWFAFAVLLLATICVAYAYYVTRAALPQLDGQLKVAGLSAPVMVTRDGHGVPVIEAANLNDLFFAQGFVTAQDRLWQMDVMRRFGGGELSEILGEETVKLDREQKVLGLRAAAKKSLEIAGARDRGFMEAYAQGVNAFISTNSHKLPIEFRILRYTPKPWTVEDSVVIANQMVKDLNYHYFYDALAREKILAKLGPELTADLYVNNSWHDRPPTVMREDLGQTESSSSDSDDDDDEESPDNSVTRQSISRGRDRTHAGRFAGEWIERLGGVGGALRHWKASAFERHAPRASDAESLVRGASALWGARCCRSIASRHAVHRCGTQSADRMGFHQCRSDRDRCIYRKFQWSGRLSNA